MEHDDDKGISMEIVQIKRHNQFETALQRMDSFKKANPYIMKYAN
jgi:hypothetical protein